MFITLEGGEGAGKSTQARRIAAYFAAAGRPVFLTREPGGTAGAEALRGLLLSRGWEGGTEMLLHFAARREHVARAIRPALAAGAVVVCDRFADSTLAYQVAGQGGARAMWQGLVELTLDGVWPDRTFLLDLPPEAGLARAAIALASLFSILLAASVFALYWKVLPDPSTYSLTGVGLYSIFIIGLHVVRARK